MTTATSGWGFGSWGLAPWGTGDEPPAVLSARAIRENCVRLTFSEAVVHDRTGSPRDGSRRELYSVTPVAGTRGLDGEDARAVLVGRVDRAGPAVLDLWLDRPLTHWPSRYVVSAFGVWSIAGLSIDPAQSSAAFDGVRAHRATRDPAAGPVVIGADIALPSTGSAAEAARAAGALLGCYAVDATGDFAFDAGLQSLVKRILRRLLAEPGAYAHLGPGYGAGLRSRVKRLASGSERSTLKKLVEQQCALEPEVAEAGASITPIAQNAWLLRVRVRTRFEQQAEFSLPLRLGE